MTLCFPNTPLYPQRRSDRLLFIERQSPYEIFPFFLGPKKRLLPPGTPQRVSFEFPSPLSRHLPLFPLCGARPPDLRVSLLLTTSAPFCERRASFFPATLCFQSPSASRPRSLFPPRSMARRVKEKRSLQLSTLPASTGPPFSRRISNPLSSDLPPSRGFGACPQGRAGR